MAFLDIDAGELEDGNAKLDAGAHVGARELPAVGFVDDTVGVDAGAAGVGVGPKVEPGTPAALYFFEVGGAQGGLSPVVLIGGVLRIGTSGIGQRRELQGQRGVGKAEVFRAVRQARKPTEFENLRGVEALGSEAFHGGLGEQGLELYRIEAGAKALLGKDEGLLEAGGCPVDIGLLAKEEAL